MSEHKQLWVFGSKRKEDENGEHCMLRKFIEVTKLRMRWAEHVVRIEKGIL
jgi:hypothetical protein